MEWNPSEQLTLIFYNSQIKKISKSSESLDINTMKFRFNSFVSYIQSFIKSNEA